MWRLHQPPTETSSRAPSPSHSSTHTSMKPEEIDYHYCHRILSALVDNLYEIYYEYKNAKELWDTLEEKYGLDDAEIEWLTSFSFNNFMMVDRKPINDQIHEFQDYICHLQLRKTNFLMTIKFLPYWSTSPSSSSFAGDLHHMQGDLTLIQTLKAIPNEDQHRLTSISSTSKVRMKWKSNWTW